MLYKVIYAENDYFDESIKIIEEAVQIVCNEGWKPQGGISIDRSAGKFRACQAMIKE